MNLPALNGKWIPFLLMILWALLLNAAIALGHSIAIGILLGFMPLLLILYLFLFDTDLYFFTLACFIPLSVKANLPGGFAVSAPAELMAVLLFARMIIDPALRRSPDPRIFRHPLFLLLMIYAGWLFLTSITSEVPKVSLKRLFITGLYIGVFFYLFATRFTDARKITGFYLAFAAGMIVPIINGALWHSQYNFSPQASYYMPQPFFIEHTLYGAVLAFILPATGYLVAREFIREGPAYRKGLFILLFAACLIAEFLSFSRAAWVSLAVIPLFLLIFHLRIRLVVLVVFIVSTVVVVLLNLDPLTRMISRNEARSNRGSITEQVKSVSNIQTDISNLERINRWKCALRMYDDRPVTGFGPGTYQFVYYRYQYRPDMTRISTVHGEKGNAHSEYLGHMAETGLPGALIFVATMLAALATAMRIIYRNGPAVERNLAIVVILCLLTFYVHAVFNAFLETDEIGSLYYVSLGALVAIDLQFYRKPA